MGDEDAEALAFGSGLEVVAVFTHLFGGGDEVAFGAVERLAGFVTEVVLCGEGESAEGGGGCETADHKGFPFEQSQNLILLRAGIADEDRGTCQFLCRL